MCVASTRFNRNRHFRPFLSCADSIDCESEEHTWWISYAMICLIVYPVGIPATFAALLCWHRSKICEVEIAGIGENASDAQLKEIADHVKDFLTQQDELSQSQFLNLLAELVPASERHVPAVEEGGRLLLRSIIKVATLELQCSRQMVLAAQAPQTSYRPEAQLEAMTGEWEAAKSDLMHVKNALRAHTSTTCVEDPAAAKLAFAELRRKLSMRRRALDPTCQTINFLYEGYEVFVL